jgi:hypothetical protein
LKTPAIITFKSIGNPTLGYISVAEKDMLPFKVKRIYWTYFTPNDVERGNHAHKKLEQIIIAASGTIRLETENLYGIKNTFKLDHPELGLYIPPLHWRKIKFSHNSVLLCLASMEYEENDYIRNYEDFKYMDNL